METLTVREGDKEITLKFDMLTIEHEDEWTDWLRLKLRKEVMDDARAMGLTGKELAEYCAPMNVATANTKCSFQTEMGLANMQTHAGVEKILSMASRKHHPTPGIPEEVIRRVVKEQTKEAVRVASECLPFKKDEDDGEKKVNGPTAGPT
jgi:hypothetical protein